jgi:hypothetical protein
MAKGFGRYGQFPFDLGGGDAFLEQEHQALLDDLVPGWDTSEDLEAFAETYVDAVAVTMIWAVNERLRQWLIPRSMLESLPVWEESTGLRPGSQTEDVERRRRVSGKLIGLVASAIGDIETAAISVLGLSFDGLVVVDPDNTIAYWPGVNPGPPGLEWSSNRARLGIRIDKTSLTDLAFEEKRQALFVQIDDMLPAWMNFQIGVGDGFTINQGVIGETFL